MAGQHDDGSAATRIVVEVHAQVSLTPENSPPAAAGSKAFAEAVERLAGPSLSLKVERIGRITVARPSYGDPVGGRRPLSWDMTTTGPEGESVDARKFEIVETAGGFDLLLNEGEGSGPAGTFPSRTLAEAVATAWQGGRLDLETSPRRDRRTA